MLVPLGTSHALRGRGSVLECPIYVSSASLNVQKGPVPSDSLRRYPLNSGHSFIL